MQVQGRLCMFAQFPVEVEVSFQALPWIASVVEVFCLSRVGRYEQARFMASMSSTLMIFRYRHRLEMRKLIQFCCFCSHRGISVPILVLLVPILVLLVQILVLLVPILGVFYLIAWGTTVIRTKHGYRKQGDILYLALLYIRSIMASDEYGPRTQYIHLTAPPYPLSLMLVATSCPPHVPRNFVFMDYGLMNVILMSSLWALSMFHRFCSSRPTTCEIGRKRSCLWSTNISVR